MTIYYKRGDVVQHIKSGIVYVVLDDYRVDHPQDTRVLCQYQTPRPRCRQYQALEARMIMPVTEGSR